MDLFDRLNPPCGECHQLDETPLDSGIRYCWGALVWRWASDRVEGCRYRDRPRYRAPYALSAEPEDQSAVEDGDAAQVSAIGPGRP